MGILIKSKQQYDTHEEEVTKQYDEASITKEGEAIIILYSDGSIILQNQEEVFIIQNDKNEMPIKINEKKVLKYETPYGKMDMETFGEEIFLNENPFYLKLSYLITLNQTTTYRNIVEITEM